MNISRDMLTHILVTLLTFIALLSLRKVFVVDILSLVWVIFYLSIYTLKSDQWITTCMVSNFELESILLIFININSKFKVTCKTATLNASRPTSELIPKKKKILTLHSFFLHFSYQNILTQLPSCALLNIFLLMKPSNMLQDGLL